MTRADIEAIAKQVFEECIALGEAGQKEYARNDSNALANFDRVAERIKVTCPCGCDHTFSLPPEAVLLVYLEKHLDGIHAYVQGHRSQREDVRGRINDGINYLILLRGMIERKAKKA